MTMLLILGAGIAAFAIFIAGCFVGHRTGRNDGSDSANRWEATYADDDRVTIATTQETIYYVGAGRFAVRTHGDQDE